jgi:hypothetical protein
LAATRQTSRAAAAALALALTAVGAPLRADEHNGCAAVNNVSNNRVSIFEIIGATGELKLIQEIPTRGVGDDGGYYSIPQIASTAPRDGRACIFVTNSRTNNVSAIILELGEEHGAMASGRLATAVPVEIGHDASFGRLGGGLALHPDETVLYTSNPASNNISTFAVDRMCNLTLLGSRVPAPPAPSDIQVKPDGRCLAVVSPVSNTVVLYSLNPLPQPTVPIPAPLDPVLGPVPAVVGPVLAPVLVRTGEFPVPGPGRATGIEFSQHVARDSLYVTKADADRTVIVHYHVRPDCSLEPTPDVTIATTGRTANLAKLDPDNRCLFVPNQGSASISLVAANHPPSGLTTFNVHPVTGDLTLVGTVEDPAFLPAGVAFAESSRGERSVYYTSFSREILRRRVTACRPGPVLDTARTGVPGNGVLRGLTVIQ